MDFGRGFFRRSPVSSEDVRPFARKAACVDKELRIRIADRGASSIFDEDEGARFDPLNSISLTIKLLRGAEGGVAYLLAVSASRTERFAPMRSAPNIFYPFIPKL